MSALGTPLLLGEEATGYQISRSVRLRSSASAYLSRTFVSGNRQIFTWNGWVKRGKLGSQQGLMYVNDGVAGTPRGGFFFNADDTFTFSLNTSGSSFNVALTTTQVFRDPSAWYMVTVAVDTTDATSSNRVKIYINGVQVTAFSTATYPTLNVNTPFNTTYTYIQGSTSAASSNFDGYLTEVNFIDGQALTPSSFGETDVLTGVWKPKRYAGTYGTNGFYLNFSDNSAATAAAIGKDSSGNGNNWTPNNISVTSGVTYDSMLDVPTPYADGGNGRGNYAVLNPLDKPYATATLSNANLNFTGTDGLSISTIGVTSGKWYAEASWTAIGAQVASLRVYATSGIYAGYSSNGQKDINTTQTAYGATFAVNNVIGIAVDIDAGTVEFFKNGASQGSISYSMTGSTWFIATGTRGTSGTNTGWLNFGQRPFAYTPPTGFKALNTQNLPEATIKKGNDYFDVTTYTGDGSSTRAVPLSIAPDLLWLKNRTAANDHILIDTVRGGTAPAKTLFSNLTNAEFTTTGAFNNYGYVDSLSGSTLNVVKGTQTSSYTNYLNSAYVGWQWKESASAGFDIVTYTGTGGGSVRTISHSLGVAPSMIISKCRGTAVLGTDSWVVYFKGFAVNDYIFLNSTGAKGSSANYLPALPTSSVFSVGGTSANVNNESGLGYVAYLFAEVAGFSKFGSVSMNGSADGAFVFTGFLPKLVMLKRTDSTSNWIMWDTVRNTYNVVGEELYPNLSNAASTVTDLDILSNGFKMRNSGFSGTWIYAAWAEAPFKNSLAR